MEEKLYFLSLASGSSGNCYYVGLKRYGILIDAGLNALQIHKALKDAGIGMETIMAVLVTHDHTDHVKSVGVLGETLYIPIYATELVHAGILKNRHVKETLVQSRRVLEKDTPFNIRDLSITAFTVPHDSADNVGYSIQYAGRTLVVVTDVGHATETICRYASQADYLVVEANYDEEMLLSGAYPLFLKQRVSSQSGHLSNSDTAELLAEIYTPKLKKIWLCHLSRDNNHPELACKTVDMRLAAAGIKTGIDVSLTALKRATPSELYEL